MMFDWTYLLVVVLPGVIFGFWAQARVKAAYEEAARIPSRRGLTGARIAERILEACGISDVKVESTSGYLTDHYHPLIKALRLSEANYSGSSLAAAGIAAHEVGHAIQHSRGYLPVLVRSALVPVQVIGGTIGQISLLLGGVLLYASPALGKWVLLAGIAGFALVFLFTLITLPVEFNASRRALAVLGDQGILEADELPVAKKVLDAAALTYVVAAVQVLMTLIYLILRYNSRRD